MSSRFRVGIELGVRRRKRRGGRGRTGAGAEEEEEDPRVPAEYGAGVARCAGIESLVRGLRGVVMFVKGCHGLFVLRPGNGMRGWLSL